MHRAVVVVMGIVLVAGCAPGSKRADGGFVPSAATGPAGVEVVDGTYHWTALSEAEPDGAVYRVEVRAANDVWFVGSDLRHWDGQTLKRFALEARGLPGWPDYAHYANTLAVLGANDVWLCGSALWHFDGAAVTERTALIPGAAADPTPLAYNACEIATDGTSTFLAAALLGQSQSPATYQLQGATLQPLDRAPPLGTYGPASLLVVHQGQLYVVGSGAFGPNNVTPGPSGLRQAGVLWARKGAELVSVSDGQNSLLAFLGASIPGDFTETAPMPRTTLPWLHSNYASIRGLGDSGEGILLTGLAMGETDGAWCLAQGIGDSREFGFILRAQGGQVTLLPDRFQGLETFRIAEAGGQLLVTTSGGAIFQGVRR